MGRGEYGQPSYGSAGRGGRLPNASAGHLVGNALYHTVGDRADAARSLDLAWEATYENVEHVVFPDLSPRMIGNTAAARDALMARPGANAQWVAWWFGTFKPAVDAWAAFKLKVLGGGETHGDAYQAYGARWASDWSEYTAWRDRLVALRNTARMLGMHLTSPDPDKLPTTFVEDVGEAAHRVIDTSIDLTKVAVYGAIGVAAIGVAIYAARSSK